MIRSLRGIIEEKGRDHVVINVGGVGYHVFVTPSGLAGLPAPGSEARIHTHLHVREDAVSIYGFLSPEELRLFELVLGVSGVGPKVGLGIVSSISPSDFYKAVLFEDEEALTLVPGVGRKTAQRLILELRDRIGVKKAEGPRPRRGGQPDVSGQAEEALIALGYSRGEAAEAVRHVRESSGGQLDLEELIHRALKSLARV
ncbi:MAG: Holliday junction branch migration protein RuvA [Firmicutes bacterium]|jgi:Holliday junction DNA helicase RuvA|nr:Holliday junction branch migration protein RuvA [Bacillota bacterium]